MWNSFTMGMSLAASWAWGASFAVTLALFETLGIVPALIWVTMNIMALPIFGYVYGRLPSFKELKENCWFVKPAMIFLMIASTWMNMQALYMIAIRIGINSWDATVGTLILSSSIVAMIAYGGLKWSILSDIWQYALMVVGVVILNFIAVNNFPQLAMGWEHIPFALWIGFTLWAGPLLDAMHYERHAVSKNPKEAFNTGGPLFGLYILLVAALAFFGGAQSLVFGAIMLFTVAMVSTSTLDSAASAFQYLVGKRWGMAAAALSVATWPLIVPMGVINLFTFYGTFRTVVVAAMFFVLFKRKELKWSH